jgi:serine/threonine protein phosphatase PrpC
VDFFKHLFKKKKPPIVDVKTAPLSDDQLKAVVKVEIIHKPQQMVVGTAQSVGKQRDHNEDSIFVMNSILADGNAEIPFGIFVIADGMGGHQHGEIASGVAIRTFSQFLVNRIYLNIISVDQAYQGESMQELVESAVFEAQQAVLRKAPGGGTTLTAAMVIGEQVTIAHVGDTRMYFIYPDGRINTVTQDHTLVRRLMDLGQLTEEQALADSRRNVLYRALGQAETLRPDIDTKLFPVPGYMLICSDGLWGVVPQTEIFRIVTNKDTLAEKCQSLVSSANDQGGPDNISVILVQFLN